jgi:hypothetical protein
VRSEWRSSLANSVTAWSGSPPIHTISSTMSRFSTRPALRKPCWNGGPVRIGFLPLGSPSNVYDLSLVKALLGAHRERPRRCRAAEQRDELAALHASTLLSEAHTADLVSKASRVFLHFLQLLLSLKRRLAYPISKGHVSQSKRQQCSCDTGCRTPNGNLRSAIGHLPVII